MGSIILELQELAANPDSNVEELLNKTYMVARKLKLEELSKWCNLELQGYQDNLENIPSYREFYGQLQVYNPYWGLQSLPVPDDIRAKITLIRFPESIGGILNYLDNGECNTLELSLSYDIRKILIKAQRAPLEPKLYFSTTNLKNILSQVRQVVLEWALKLEEEGILGEGIQFSKSEKEKAMTTQFHIQNMQGFVGNISGGNMQQNIYDGIHVEANNFDQLADVLSKNGIPFSELSSLKEAIDLDEKPTEANKFGANVSQWIGNIMTKASSGVINVSLATIAGLLTNAISQYYGLM
ncbi:hypothetical protein [Alysiella crassa]|uniref:AbiTii domain-containing protein n=1 Tax=Alysiella crassa TaxID=153491 RepID=A0A376BVL1_9NEIS|nr:hypothetical protein [Alysiella crassa]UOP06369.1 hypothetical protein LVJ80_11350 [Alysiella crassa]SSY80881.1 Uncharacterised protein [Alysiella crassa]